MKKRYLVPEDYMADPSVHVFDGKVYIYPSHDYESGIPEDDWGSHFNMRDYHVFSLDDVMEGPVTDHGVVLDVDDVPWAKRQMWDCDCCEKDGKYYLYFPAKDKTDIFRLGVAVSDTPYGPFVPEPDPIRGSYSIDPAVFKDDDGQVYVYFGGLMGGQLQRYKDNSALEKAEFPADDEPAIPSRVVRLTDDMKQFAEAPRPVVVLGQDGKPLTASDPHRFFEASWMHKYKGKYYFSYSTGDTHFLCYAVGDNPYGPFVYQGVILNHDSVPSGGRTWLRSLKVCELQYDEEGRILPIEGLDE